jgi:hypothetical protein
MMINKQVRSILVGAVLAASGLLLTTCSVVFTSTLNGTVVDKDDYENGGSSIDPGVNDVEVYLYFSETDRDIDYDLWKEEDISPDDAKIKRYEVDTKTGIEPTTGTAGYFSFDSIAWNNLFPEYGNAEDVIEVFFLFQRESYGVTKEKATITSDADNTVGPIVLERTEDREIRYGGRLNGLIWFDSGDGAGGAPDGTYNSGEEINGAEIKLYVDRSSDPGSATPDYATYSLTDSSGNSGVFEISEVLWKDTMNAQRYSDVTCYIKAAYPGLGSKNFSFTMYANTGNFVVIELE